MTKDLTKSEFLRKAERLERVQELLSQKFSQTKISSILGVSAATVASDIKTLAILTNGLLSPEVCAAKRISIDNSLLDLAKEGLEAYKSLIEEDPRAAVEFFKTIVGIHRYRSKLWGGELSPSEMKPAPSSLSLTKVDKVEVNVSNKKKREIQEAITGR